MNYFWAYAAASVSSSATAGSNWAPGEFIIVPRGIEHRTVADEEAEVLVFEPAAVRNTTNVEHPTFNSAEWREVVT